MIVGIFFFFVFLLCWIQVADQYWEPLDVKIHMLILLVPLILINYIRNLKLLAPFSTLANVITFVGLTMILVYMFKDLPSPKEREMFGTLRNFSLYFGTTLFALEAVGVVSLISFLLFVSLLCFYRLSYNKLVCYLERQLWFIETTKSIEMTRKMTISIYINNTITQVSSCTFAIIKSWYLLRKKSFQFDLFIRNNF